MAKRKPMWLGASTYRRQRSAGWRRLALSRKAWSPREEERPMKNRRPPGHPRLSGPGPRLRVPYAHFLEKSLRVQPAVSP